jgi:hypothetical protein
VDAIFLGDSETNINDLRALCAATHGVFLTSPTEAEAVEFVQREAFLDLQFRGRFPADPPITELRNPRASPPLQKELPKPANCQVIPFDRVRFWTPTYRVTRIRDEIGNSHRPFVSVIDARVPPAALWRTVVPGQLLAKPSVALFWVLEVTFPPDYPFARPAFRLLSRPPEPIRGVSETGRVAPLVLGEYHPRVRLADLLARIGHALQRAATWDEARWLRGEGQGMPLASWQKLGDPRECQMEIGDVAMRRFSPISWKELETTVKEAPLGEGDGFLLAPDEVWCLGRP